MERVNAFGKLETVDEEKKLFQEEPGFEYQSEFNQCSYQQERIISFGKMDVVRNYLILFIITFLFGTYTLISTMTLESVTDIDRVVTILTILINVVVSGFIIAAINNFRKGSINNDPLHAKKGTDTLRMLYKISYVLTIISAVLAGIALFFLMISASMVPGGFLFVFVYAILIGVLIAISLYFLKNLIEFFETVSLNLAKKKSLKNYAVPKTNVIRVFLIIGIVLIVLATLFIVIISESLPEIYQGSLATFTVQNYIAYGLNILNFSYLLYMIKKFDDNILFYRRKVS